MTSAPMKLSNNFEPFTIALIREMESYDWTGRVSRKGHAILRSPDGRATCSVAPKVGDPRNKHNMAMDFRQWLREQAQEPAEQPQEPAVATEWLPWPVMPPPPLVEAVEPEPEPDPEHLCGECLRDFATLQALSVHRVRAHVRVNCPVCDRPFSPGNLPRHQATHTREFPTHESALRAVHQLRADLARIQAELGTWQSLAEETEESLVNMLGGASTRTR